MINGKNIYGQISSAFRVTLYSESSVYPIMSKRYFLAKFLIFIITSVEKICEIFALITLLPVSYSLTSLRSFMVIYRWALCENPM